MRAGNPGSTSSNQVPSIGGVLLALLVLIGIWQVIATLLDTVILPPPAIVLQTFVKEMPGELSLHVWASLQRIFLATGLAMITATPLGLLIGQSKMLNMLLSPFIYIIYPIPKVIFLPLLLLFFGLDDKPKVILIFLVLFFQILVMTRDAAADIRQEMIISIRSLGANKQQLWLHVYFPYCLPTVMSAIRVSISTSIAVLFVAESFATRKGVGYYIVDKAWNLRDYPKMYAGILILGITGSTLYLIFDWVERLICPWKDAELP